MAFTNRIQYAHGLSAPEEGSWFNASAAPATVAVHAPDL